MNDTSIENISVPLAAFLRAGDDDASSELLICLIDERVQPLIEGLIRNKFQVSLSRTDERTANQDALDLVSEVRTLILRSLCKLKSGSADCPIGNFEAYVKTVAINVCNQYLRSKYPNRFRLKNQLRYLLSHEPRFALWQTGVGWYCGFSDRGRRNEPDAPDVEGFAILNDRIEQAIGRQATPADQMSLTEIVTAVFDEANTPLRFSDLVSIVYRLRRIKERTEITEDDLLHEKLLRQESDVTSRLEDKEFLCSMWKEIALLPLRHRAALLLNLKNHEGEGLITLLPITRIATIEQIAAMLEISFDQFARIWNELPWDDLTIAGHLGITRQQVINLRQSARSTLRRRMNG